MNDIDPDRLVFEQMMSRPGARAELTRVHQLLDESIKRSKFNRERAEEMFLFVVNNCAHRFFRGLPGRAAVLYPKTIRQPFAVELTQEFVRSRNDIASQRPARHGILRYLIGK